MTKSIAHKTVQSQFENALDNALHLDGTRDAEHLPGWAGADPQ